MDENESTTVVDQEADPAASPGDGEARLGEPTADGQRQPEEESPEGEPEEPAARPRSTHVPYERFQEVNERSRQAESAAAFWRGKFEAMQKPAEGPKRPELPAELQELDKTMSPWLRHHLDPVRELAEGLQGRTRAMHEWMADRLNFYDDYPQYRDKEHRTVIEQATLALSERLGKRVDREDVLLYLRGHPKFGAQFADQEAEQQRQQQELAEAEVTARRGAGKVGGRAPVKKSQGEQAPDLASMSPAERVKYLESTRGNDPF